MSGDEKLLAESLKLIYDIERMLKEYYLRGELDLKKYQGYKLGVDYLYLSYNRLVTLNSSSITKSLSNFLYKKKSNSLDMNKDYLVELINIVKYVREKRFSNLDDILNKISNMKFKVKCLTCKKAEGYKGQGIILKYQSELKLEQDAIGGWFCSDGCYRK